MIGWGSIGSSVGGEEVAARNELRSALDSPQGRWGMAGSPVARNATDFAIPSAAGRTTGIRPESRVEGGSLFSHESAWIGS
jgi:hypothetical protein